MDTRNKIIDTQTALRLDRQRLAVAAGAFDVLQASDARFLETIRPPDGKLLVVVWSDASLSQPVLPEQARAQLVAALRSVTYVVIAARGGELETLVKWAVPEERNIIGVVLQRTAEEYR